jgi:hypothetical protein
MAGVIRPDIRVGSEAAVAEKNCESRYYKQSVHVGYPYLPRDPRLSSRHILKIILLGRRSFSAPTCTGCDTGAPL